VQAPPAPPAQPLPVAAPQETPPAAPQEPQGQEQQEGKKRFCPSCGEPVKSTDKHCANCGGKLGD